MGKVNFEDINDNMILNVELNKKNEELNGLKSKNKLDRIINISKICAMVIFLGIEISIGIYFLQKYGLIDDIKHNNINSEYTNIVTIDINKELTIDYVNNLIKTMEEYKDDKSVKEILITMNCPGGSPVAADKITSYIKDYNKTKKINMYVQTMAASGGYYIASAIKPLVANQNAIVGSIGVIMPKYTIKKLADTIGVEEDNIVVGDYKVPATLFNNVTNEQKDYLKNNLLIPTYDNFVQTVATNRGITIESLVPFTQGKIFVANKLEIKNVLVDKVTNLIDFKNEIIENISVKDKIKKDKIKFINIENKDIKNSLFKINLDLNSLIKENSLNLEI